ncbi:hypothetical protein BDM02DRAFT_526911 [Thelephora ganbajun]|uniref:Uncharacterized protein n=1 Tax=Thelephora ganbajun TaxID=370292 RepID=A0ACB6ZQK6_THEGA|nr:hypothetical protein BDM02DRAFT_526911 [Thelephora ganbajun]
MGLGKFFKSFSSSSSGSSSSRPQGNNRPPLGPGSSKADYAYGLNSSDPSTSSGLAQSHDAPPPYDPQDSSDFNNWAMDSKLSTAHKVHADAVYRATPDRIHNLTDSRGEHPLKVLENYDIIIVLDDSFSMMIADNPSGRTRWDQAWDALETLVQVGVKYDRSGIDIHFLNQRKANRTVKNVGDLRRLRSEVKEPRKESYTPTGDVLDMLLLEYRKQTGNSPGRAAVKKRIFIVITDGAATDAPQDVIINAANFFQKNHFPLDQVGIQFIQVGNDLEAEEFLDELDTDLVKQMGEHARDIVDTLKSNGNDLKGDALVKALTGGFNRKQDRTGEK